MLRNEWPVSRWSRQIGHPGTICNGNADWRNLARTIVRSLQLGPTARLTQYGIRTSTRYYDSLSDTGRSSNLGELTDKGRETTLALGERLRHLYVDQLGFMPKIIADADMMYLRATPMPRALESMQQTFCGMYPLTARTASFPPPTVITRTPADETLFPNDSNCRRFSQLSRAFAQRTADRCKPASPYLPTSLSQ